jgi:hypothetical protein
VTPLSARALLVAQRPLLFTYFENAGYNTYVVEDPRTLPRQRVARRVVARADEAAAPASGVIAPDSAMPPATAPAVDSTGAVASADGVAGDGIAGDGADAPPAFISSYYRTPDGVFRRSEETPVAEQAMNPPISIVALLDSAALALPDTSTFDRTPYRAKLTADIIGRPSVGTEMGGHYGNGVYGGSYIALSDMLGNHNLMVAGSVNGSFSMPASSRATATCGTA